MIRHRDELAGEDLELLKILDLTKGISPPPSSLQTTRASLSRLRDEALGEEPPLSFLQPQDVSSGAGTESDNGIYSFLPVAYLFCFSSLRTEFHLCALRASQTFLVGPPSRWLL